MDLGGRDITSVQYQNANNSVRVTDEFMRAVEDGTEFGLRARKTGEVIETVDARELFRKISQAAWECADPGLQYDDTINDWHTNPETGRITATNPCSRVHVARQLLVQPASLNLLKFLKDDDTFDAERFAKAVEMIITAMDISICFADFPTEAIGETTRDYRQLGIGYANLGALLMAMGLGYDSDGGRAMAAAITSLMTGDVLPSLGRARRRGRSVRRLRPQRRGAQAGDAQAPGRQRRGPHARHRRRAGAQLATKAWADVQKIGETNGFRNAQASVLAPTGTIGFMMDCDTTGIEPDFSLVKFKKLVGGGSMQIVNQTIPRALRKLGYAEEQIEAIVEYIAEHGHVIDAPGLQAGALRGLRLRDGRAGDQADGPRPDDGGRAAVPVAVRSPRRQPAGDSHVEDIEDIYIQGWKLGLKATRGLPRQLQGRPAAVRRQAELRPTRPQRPPAPTRPRPSRRSSTPDAQAAAEVAPVADHVVHGRRRRGLHDRRLLPDDGARRGLPQARQAGLDPGRRDGRLLDRGLDRPAVRRPAGDLRLEVHQPVASSPPA